MTIKNIFVLAVILLTAYTPHLWAGGESRKASVNEKVLLVAKDFIDKEYPALDKTGMKRIVTEKAGYWEVTFDLPSESDDYPNAGLAAPVILINKKTFTVRKVSVEQ